MKKGLLFVGLLAVLLIPAMLIAQDDLGEQAVNTDAIIEPGDSDVLTDEPTIQGDSNAEGGAVANVINPDASSEGQIRIRLDSEGYAEIHRSGSLVERMELVLLEDGTCKQALGQIGKVMVCGDDITVSLLGRPDFKCAKTSGEYSEPCVVPAA
ncbi:MAG: hypothetical protein GYA55_08540 [SAR324 cluster bacterium]|uniref:Uncharacterized protein n=1 Tax=SAR324 cluster bacterium TaxID=2024889 RepID=A0A7X9FSV7_9DELT|nr:hypothetical protein [SAR324 cluster bacterium]